MTNILNTKSKICIAKDFQTEKSSVTAKVRNESDTKNEKEVHIKTEGWFDFKTELKWCNIIHLTLLHVGFLYALLTFNWCKNLKTTLWIFVLLAMQAIGTNGGVHRLWTHRAYKATWQLRVILLICYATAGQNNPYTWVRDHRVHHKYTDTDADPHNSTRGFFFSHVGWLMMKKHPEVIRRGRQIDMSDVMADRVYAFGHKYFMILKIVFSLLLPVIIPAYAWNETWGRAIMSQIFLRQVIGFNTTWSVNSAAHMWGSRPYSEDIKPAENRLVSFLSGGEGWHNYHHTFPWDYKTAELSNYKLNFTTMVIDFFAKIGWAYDRKQASEEFVRTIVTQRGDGSYSWDAELYLDSKIK